MKAAAEELAGMQECWKTMGIMVRNAERIAAESEAHLDALLKLRGFLAIRIDEQQDKLNALREAAEAAAKGGEQPAETPP